MSTVKSLYHIVINTKHRQMSIPEENKRRLYLYIYGLIQNQKCTLIRMNGIPNHIHLLIDLSVEISLSQFMRELKRSTSIWMKQHPEMFPDFIGWGKEYYAFSCGVREKDAVVAYIKGQEAHHNVSSFDDEMKSISLSNECDYYTYD